MALAPFTVVFIGAGYAHNCVITDRGDVYAWGASRTPSHTDANAPANTPSLIKVLSGKSIVQVRFWLFLSHV